MRNTLNKTERLKSRKQIELLFKEGQRIHVPLLKVFYVIRKEAQPVDVVRLQFGIGASSRFFKRAVDRNRIKRLGRETWRVQKHLLRGLLEQQNRQLTVFFIYTGKELPEYEELYASTTEAIQKLMKRLS